MCFFKNKFEKIKRSDVVENIINVEKKQQEEMDAVEEREKEIDKLLKAGSETKSRDRQLTLAKRINLLRKENQMANQRIQYLNANLLALNQLKTAIDDKEFINNNSDMPINKLLTDANALRKFIGGISGQKMRSESMLGETLDAFEEVEEAYEGDERIYGINEQDDQLLSMFEISGAEKDAESFGASISDEVDKQGESSSI